MNAISDPSTIELSALESEARRLYGEILPMLRDAHNVWRTAWAMDTVLDYYRLCGVDGSAQAQTALNALDPRQQGNWWDDFGWIGIAALRAAEQDAFPGQRDLFLKIAINAWAYMYGPGWETNGSGAIYPFTDTDLPGWQCFAERIAKTPLGNIGALKVWDAMDRTFRCDVNAAQASGDFDQLCFFEPPTIEQKYRQQPRFSPGGAWNSPIYHDHCPDPLDAYVQQDSGRDGYDQALNPAQNTVTNGLFALLSLRIFQASSKAEYRAVFEASNLDAGACRAAWQHQAAWLDSWCLDGTLQADETLSTTPGDHSGSLLIRERVSTYRDARTGRVYWDPGYRRNLIWTGDQGLVLGVLREGRLLQPQAPTFASPEALIAGVFEYGYAPRRYAAGQPLAPFLLPWLELRTRGDARFAVWPPGRDMADYQTGVALFMRYLLQAYEATPGVLSQAYADVVLESALAVLALGASDTLSAEPPGQCDAFTPCDDKAVNQAARPMTSLINRLSVLLMAIAIRRSGRTAKAG